MSRPVFITEDFLLENETARRLYHDWAKDMPIFDYHCHLPPDQIAADSRFPNLTRIWLEGDHYKWRAMRAAGVDERRITGDASDWEKFEAWAETVPQTLRNPLYHWTHLELNRPFGISDRLLSPDTAKGIWDECGEMLSKPEFSCRGIMKQMNVVLVCTTDDPVDSLESHRIIAEDPEFDIAVLPAWRPDKGMAVEIPDQFNVWVDRLSEAADVEISDFPSYMSALEKRHEFFHSRGCRLSDHGIETFYAEEFTENELRNIFQKVRSGGRLETREILKFKSGMLYEFGVMDHATGWTQQYHFGAIRNNNSRMFDRLGPDAGFDSMGDFEIALPMGKFLDRLERDNRLTRTILYNNNPRDNEIVATMIGNFQDGQIRGKMQFGSAWWHMDQKDGMEKQLEALSNMGMLSTFIGMLTDSRSFLSYPRHEYFRRILCNLLGDEIERGLLPNDMDWIGKTVQDICYNNAVEYLQFETQPAVKKA